MRLLVSLVLLCVSATVAQNHTAFSDVELLDAFAVVFDPDNAVVSTRVTQVQLALQQLRKIGVVDLDLCALAPPRQALLLMQNAKFYIEEDLREKNDWKIVYTQNRFHRTRSYAFVRFAMVECLLLIAVVGLAYLIWKKPME